MNNWRRIFYVISLVCIGMMFGCRNEHENNKEKDIAKNEESILTTSNSFTDVKKVYQTDCGCESIISLNPLVVQYAQIDCVMCDSASSAMQINFCSGVEVCLAKGRLDSLNNVVLTIYDSLIIQYNKNILEDSSDLEYATDYELIKQLHIESIVKFLEYVNIEMNIAGQEAGKCQTQTFIENNRFIEILEPKILELERMISENKR